MRRIILRVGWLFNGIEESICDTWGGEVNRFSRLRMANELRDTEHTITLRYTITTVTSKTLQLHNRNNRLSNCMTYLLIITLEPSPIPNWQKPHTLFVIISIGVDANFTCVRQLILEQRGRCKSCTPSFVLNISVARRTFLLCFGVFLEPSKPDGMMLRISK